MTEAANAVHIDERLICPTAQVVRRFACGLCADQRSEG